MEDSMQINNKEDNGIKSKQELKLSKAQKLIKYQKNIINKIYSLFSGAIGYMPGIGAIKNIAESSIGYDIITKRNIKTPEKLFKALAGVTGITGYYFLFKPFVTGTGEASLKDLSLYATFSLTNSILYTYSLVLAGTFKDTLHQKKEKITKLLSAKKKFNKDSK